MHDVSHQGSPHSLREVQELSWMDQEEDTPLAEEADSWVAAMDETVTFVILATMLLSRGEGEVKTGVQEIASRAEIAGLRLLVEIDRDRP